LLARNHVLHNQDLYHLVKYHKQDTAYNQYPASGYNAAPNAFHPGKVSLWPLR
jgi:hypothetical protein